jgi:hypothetical protein
MAEYFQIVRGGAWSYGPIQCHNGMIVAWQPGNNERLIENHMMAPWDGGVDGLPRCETCDCWFISPGMFQGHLDKLHGQGIREMKERRDAAINQLGGLRDQAAALTDKIAVLHEGVLALDRLIDAKEQELVAAQGTVTTPQPKPVVDKSARVSLGRA